MGAVAIRGDLLIQRDLLLEDYPTIDGAIRDENFTLPESDEAVLLVSDRGKLFEFNLVAAFIFEKLRSGASKDEIVNGIVEHFDVGPCIAESDFDGFVRFLKAVSLATEKEQ